MFLQRVLQASAALSLLSRTSAQTACNNSPSLCSKAYNNITHLGAHDSPFLRDESTSFSTAGNQFFNSTVQLNAGVRLLSAQVHRKNDTTGSQQWHLCHGDCIFLDAGLLEDWLKEIKTWMDANTNDVVTVLLVNGDGAKASDLGPIFASSGIDDLAYSPPTAGTIPTTWPTLQSLISNNTRLMTFVASLSPPSSEFPYLMDEFTYMFENSFENRSPTDYSCNPDRPTSLTNTSQAASSGRMFLQNHFLYTNGGFFDSPNATYVNTTNAQTGLGALGEALKTCTSVYGKAANFVLVDFFNVGPAIASVDAANGVSSAVGRKTVTQEVVEPSANGVGRRKASILAVVVAFSTVVELVL
jgi:hypothetical protein